MSSADPATHLLRALCRVTALRFDARGRLWTGRGHGFVAVEVTTDEVVTFFESGAWQAETGKEFQFRNVFRWSRTDPARVRLEHLRFGPEHPVVLFDLVPAGDGWRTDEAHLCRADCYSAELQIREAEVWVCWQVSGPKKDEAIEYVYRW